MIDEDITPDGMVFLVMELLVGETLDQRWTRLGRRVPVGDAIAIAAEMMNPLVAVHRVGIIHRSQAIERLPEHAGIEAARLRRGEAGRSARTRVRLPSGSMLGTPAYLAPEQARGHWDQVDARTDIWAASSDPSRF